MHTYPQSSYLNTNISTTLIFLLVCSSFSLYSYLLSVWHFYLYRCSIYPSVLFLHFFRSVTIVPHASYSPTPISTSSSNTIQSSPSSSQSYCFFLSNSHTILAPALSSTYHYLFATHALISQEPFSTFYATDLNPSPSLTVICTIFTSLSLSRRRDCPIGGHFCITMRSICTCRYFEVSRYKYLSFIRLISVNYYGAVI